MAPLELWEARDTLCTMGGCWVSNNMPRAPTVLNNFTSADTNFFYVFNSTAQNPPDTDPVTHKKHKRHKMHKMHIRAHKEEGITEVLELVLGSR